MTAATRPGSLAESLADRIAADAATGGPFGPDATAARDEAERFPDDEVRLLDAWGGPAAFVPARLGGAPGDVHDLFDVVRVLAEHDLTLAVGYCKTYLGAAPVWVAGGPEQQAQVARLVMVEHAVASWGLTEPGRGSDLAAGTTRARRRPDGAWVLDGTKWPVNNASRGRLLTVLARTADRPGPAGTSVLLVDGADIGPGGRTPLPKARTHGIRGADISGVRFSEAVLPAGALVGQEGTGLRTTLLALQFTRMVTAALSVAALTSAHRVVGEFAHARELHGTRLARLPHAARVLADAAAALDLVVSGCRTALGTSATRPAELSVVSALVKAGVPTLAQRHLTALAQLYGARGYLAPGPVSDGRFARLERDHRIVAIFDGSTAVNRAGVVAQLPVVAARHAARHAAGPAAGGDLLDLLAAARDRRPADYGGATLLSRDGCTLLGVLTDPSAPGAAGVLAGALSATLEAGRALRTVADRQEPAAVQLVARLELLYLAAAVELRRRAGELADDRAERALSLAARQVQALPLDAEVAA
ncbi:acyl-CoA dehydrogenase family protein [Cellulomonas phragmiteti]|nr:acyl-CoA dehydrogenase family protein [Cellulomonas phragmiteti]